MALGEFKLDVNAINNVGTSLSNVISENQKIKSAANNIDAGLVSDFSPSAGSNVSGILSNVNTLMTSLDELETSYGLAKDELIKAYEAAQKAVQDDLKDGQDLSGTNEINYELQGSIGEGLNQTLAFYFNYPAAAKEAKQVSESSLRSALEKQGAKLLSDGNTYKMTINGKTYKYNVQTGIVQMGDSRDGIYARYFATTSDLSKITHTITLMGGSGTVDSNRIDPNLKSGVKANSNSLIILPYSSGINNKADYVAGATRIGDFMVGGKSKKVTNSIVGYSLGGHIATRTVSRNKGLYQAIVYVNSGAYTSDLKIDLISRAKGSIDAFKDIKIIFFEGSNDKFVKSAAKTINTFTTNGVPKSNIYVYTSDKTLISKYTPYLGKSHVQAVPDGYVKKSSDGWRGHSYGFNMIKNSNIVNYLSTI